MPYTTYDLSKDKDKAYTTAITGGEATAVASNPGAYNDLSAYVTPVPLMHDSQSYALNGSGTSYAQQINPLDDPNRRLGVSSALQQLPPVVSDAFITQYNQQLTTSPDTVQTWLLSNFPQPVAAVPGLWHIGDQQVVDPTAKSPQPGLGKQLLAPLQAIGNVATLGIVHPPAPLTNIPVGGGPVGGSPTGGFGGAGPLEAARALGVNAPNSPLLDTITNPYNLIGAGEQSARTLAATAIATGLGQQAGSGLVKQLGGNETEQNIAGFAGGLGGGLAAYHGVNGGFGRNRLNADGSIDAEWWRVIDDSKTPGYNEPAMESYLQVASMAKVRGGQDPEDAARMIDIERKRLYSGAIDAVATKELLQNSIDAVRGQDKGVIRLNYDPSTNAITIYDNGHGMTSKVLGSKFINPGGSEKPDGSSGGFGRAKIVYLGNAESVEVLTTAKVGGEYVTSRLTSGSLADIMRDGADVSIVDRSPTGTTGTSVRIKLKTDVHLSAEETSNWMKRFDAFSRLPSHIHIEHDLHDGVPEVDGPFEPMGTVNYRNGAAYMEPFLSPDTVASTSVAVHFLNNGMYQFTKEYLVSNDPIPVPAHVVIDITPNVKPDHADYPFKLDRESIAERTDEVIRQRIIKGLQAAGAKVMQNEMQVAIDTSPKMLGRNEHVIDTTGQFPVEYVNEIAAKPYLHALMPKIIEYFNKWGTAVGALPGYGSANKAEFFGWGLGPRWRGLHVYADYVSSGRSDVTEIQHQLDVAKAAAADPAQASSGIDWAENVRARERDLVWAQEQAAKSRSKDMMMLNPFTLMRAAEDFVGEAHHFGRIPHDELVATLSKQIALVIAHEALHSKVHTDNEPFGVALGDLIANNLDMLSANANAIKYLLKDVDIEQWRNDTADYHQRVFALGDAKRNFLERASNSYGVTEQARSLGDSSHSRSLHDAIQTTFRDGAQAVPTSVWGAGSTDDLGASATDGSTAGSRTRTSPLPDSVAAIVTTNAQRIRTRTGAFPPGDSPELAKYTGGAGTDLGNQHAANWAVLLDSPNIGWSEMRAYHGTYHDFSGLPSTGHRANFRDYSMSDEMVYYTTDPAIASQYAGMDTLDFSLLGGKPTDFIQTGSRVVPAEINDNAKLFDPRKDRWPAGTEALAADFKKFMAEDKGQTQLWDSFIGPRDDADRKGLLAKLKDAGYDGTQTATEIAVWNRDVVKPAYRDNLEPQPGFSRAEPGIGPDERELMRMLDEIENGGATPPPPPGGRPPPLEGDYLPPRARKGRPAGVDNSINELRAAAPDPLGDPSMLIPGTAPIKYRTELTPLTGERKVTNRIDVNAANPRELMQVGQSLFGRYFGSLRNYQADTTRRANEFSKRVRKDKAAAKLFKELGSTGMGKLIESGSIADAPLALRPYIEELLQYRNAIEARDVAYKAEFGTSFLKRKVDYQAPRGTGVGMPEDGTNRIDPIDDGFDDVFISEYFPALFKAPKGGWENWIKGLSSGRAQPGTSEFNQRRRARVVDDPTAEGGVRLATPDEIGRPRTFSEAVDIFGLEPADDNPANMLAMRDIAGMRRIQKDMLLERMKSWGLATWDVTTAAMGERGARSKLAQKNPGWEVSKVIGFDVRSFPTADGGVVMGAWLVPHEVKTLLDDAFDVNSNETYRKAIRTGIWLPVRLKLLGFVLSLFQHIDIGLMRTTATAVERALNEVTPSRERPFAMVTGLPGAAGRLAKLPTVWLENAAASLIPQYRELLQRQWTTDPFLSNLTKHGANIQATQDFIRTSELGGLAKEFHKFPFIGGLADVNGLGPLRLPFKAINALDSWWQEGLFNGLYLSSAKHMALDMRRSIELRHPEWTEDQKAAAIADNLNTLMSSIENWQSVLRNEGMRDLMRGIIISFNEQEGMFRSFVRGLGALKSIGVDSPVGAPLRMAGRGVMAALPEGARERVDNVAGSTGRTPAAKAFEDYWLRYWTGYVITTLLIANVINYAVTGQLIQTSQLSPIRIDRNGQPRFNTRFMRPIIGFTENSQPIFLDIWGQMDTPLRWLSDPETTANNRLTQGARFMVEFFKNRAYDGVQLSDDPNKYRNWIARVGKLAPELVTPITLSNFKAGDGLSSEEGLVISTVGANTYAGGLSDARNKVSQDMGLGNNYDDLSPAEKERVDKTGDIQNVLKQQREYQAARGNTFSTDTTAMTEKYRAASMAIEESYKRGDYLTHPDEATLPDKFKDLAQQRLGSRSTIEQTFAKTIDGFNRDQVDKDLDAYYAILSRTLDDTSYGPAGSVNWQDTIKRRDAYLAGLGGPRTRDLTEMLNVIEGHNTPLYTEFRTDMNKLDSMGYPFGTAATKNFQENNKDADLIMWKWYGASLNTVDAVNTALTMIKQYPMPIKLDGISRRIDTDPKGWQALGPSVQYYLNLPADKRSVALEGYPTVNAAMVYWGGTDRLRTPAAVNAFDSYIQQSGAISPQQWSVLQQPMEWYFQLTNTNQVKALATPGYEQIEAAVAWYNLTMFGRPPVFHSTRARDIFGQLSGLPSAQYPVLIP